jgi:hypothetical protein
VAEDVVVYFNHGRQCTLAETSNGANGEFAVWSCKCEFIGIAGLPQVTFAEPEIEAELRQ